jgi:hypothetical protein
MERMTAKRPEDRFANPIEVVAALAPFAEGHDLSQVVRQAMPTSPHSPTVGGARTDTLIAKSAESDTRTSRAQKSWGLPKALPPSARKKLLRTASALLTLAAVAAIGWLVIQATGRRESAQEARQARGHALQVASGFAASEILKEINLRFDILSRLASDEELRQNMNQIMRSPDDETLWRPLENWLGARKADYEREAPADSWFINDVRGVQVARSPRSPASRGANYAHRDYFHGKGADLPEGTEGLTPTATPHLSAVYRSTSTGHLKVAFSVPIENGRRGSERGVIGVLAMSVDLGEFNVLEKQLPPGQEVVLLDLREASVDGQTRRGLVLHHQRQDSYQEGESPPWIASDLLDRIDALVESAKSAAPGQGSMLVDYRDEALTGDKEYWGALRPVVDSRPEGHVGDTRWLVLVQEPVLR